MPRIGCESRVYLVPSTEITKMAKNESYIQHPVDTVGFGGSSRILDLKRVVMTKNAANKTKLTTLDVMATLMLNFLSLYYSFFSLKHVFSGNLFKPLEPACWFNNELTDQSESSNISCLR